MRILVTGGNGQLGSALKNILSKEDALFTDTDNMDITSKEQIKKIFSEFSPEVLIHGAAYTNVDGCEENKDLAMSVNAQGTKNLAKMCTEFGVKTIYISTDYVFDGAKKSPYLTDDAPNPQSVYGFSKLEGENAVKDVQDWWILRTSWVYGDGNNFVKTMLRLSESMSEIKVVSDQLGRPTWAEDLARAIYDVVIKGPNSGIYHVTGDGPVISWADFAKKIFKIAGKKTKVTPISTSEYLADKKGKKIAKRPHYSVLDLTKTKESKIYLTDWEGSLKKYILEQK